MTKELDRLIERFHREKDKSKRKLIRELIYLENQIAINWKLVKCI